MKFVSATRVFAARSIEADSRRGTRLRLLTTCAFIAVAIAIATPASAGAITYTDRASFDTAAGAQTTITFDALAPSYLTYFGTQLTVADATFTETDSRLWVLKATDYATDFQSAYLNNNSGPAPLVISFANPVNAVGADWGYINFGYTPTAATFSFSNGESITAAVPQVAGQEGSPIFLGFVFDTPFTSLSISGASNGIALDNLSYSAGAPIPTPEPTSMLMLGSGLAGVIARQRWRASGR